MTRINEESNRPEQDLQDKEERAEEPVRRRHRRGPGGRFTKVFLGILAGVAAAVFLLYLYLFLTA